MAILSGVALKHPQSTYAGLQKSLQQEWAFVQRVTPGVGAAFGLVEEALWEVFLPALFQGLKEGLPTRANTRLPVKQAGLAIPDPIKTAPENWTASCVITGHLVAALRGQAAFRTANGTACLRGGAAGRVAQGGATGGSGVDGGTGGGPGPAGTLNATGGKDRGLAHGAAVHSEGHRAGGPVVA